MTEHVARLERTDTVRDVCATCGSVTAHAVRIGTDVQAVDAVADAVERLGHRYLDYVFTPAEVAASGWPDASPQHTASSLAGRFAAKEAAIKVLRPEGPRVPWRDLEVVRHPAGWPSIALHGRADVLARAAHLHSWTLSFSHDGDVAIATVLAIEGSTASTPTSDPGRVEGNERGRDHS